VYYEKSRGFYGKDAEPFEARAAGNAPVIAIARVAVIKKAADAKAQLDGVPAEARGDKLGSAATTPTVDDRLSALVTDHAVEAWYHPSIA
jgi:hypothetical protein